MIKGDRIKLFGHDMEVQVRKESLDLVRYDLMCTCCTYPRNLVIECTEKTLEKMKSGGLDRDDLPYYRSENKK